MIHKRKFMDFFLRVSQALISSGSSMATLTSGRLGWRRCSRSLRCSTMPKLLRMQMRMPCRPMFPRWISHFQEVQVQAPICKARDLPGDRVVQTCTPAAGIRPAKMILVDGSAALCRAYYKLVAKSGGEGLETCPEADWVLTVFTALKTILGLLDLSPSHFVVVFDHRGSNFRHTLFPDYKKNRPPTPATILQGLDHLIPALISMGIKVLEVPGVEADDVIATIATSTASPQIKVRIVSPDKDFFQIVSPDIRLLRFAPKGPDMSTFGLEEFAARFGDIRPAQFVDVLSLVGDACDNVPGVRGIGEKTAIQLITQFGSVENLLRNRDKVTIKRAIKGLLADNGEALLSKRLVALRCDLPSYMIPFTTDDYVWRKPHDNGQRLFDLLKAMSSFIESSMHIELQDRILQLWTRLEQA